MMCLCQSFLKVSEFVLQIVLNLLNSQLKLLIWLLSLASLSFYHMPSIKVILLSSLFGFSVLKDLCVYPSYQLFPPCGNLFLLPLLCWFFLSLLLVYLFSQ